MHRLKNGKTIIALTVALFMDASNAAHIVTWDNLQRITGLHQNIIDKNILNKYSEMYMYGSVLTGAGPQITRTINCTQACASNPTWCQTENSATSITLIVESTYAQSYYCTKFKVICNQNYSANAGHNRCLYSTRTAPWATHP